MMRAAVRWPDAHAVTDAEDDVLRLRACVGIDRDDFEISAVTQDRGIILGRLDGEGVDAGSGI